MPDNVADERKEPQRNQEKFSFLIGRGSNRLWAAQLQVTNLDM